MYASIKRKIPKVQSKKTYWVASLIAAVISLPIGAVILTALRSGLNEYHDNVGEFVDERARSRTNIQFDIGPKRIKERKEELERQIAVQRYYEETHETENSTNVLEK